MKIKTISIWKWLKLVFLILIGLVVLTIIVEFLNLQYEKYRFETTVFQVKSLMKKRKSGPMPADMISL